MWHTIPHKEWCALRLLLYLCLALWVVSTMVKFMLRQCSRPQSHYGKMIGRHNFRQQSFSTTHHEIIQHVLPPAPTTMPRKAAIRGHPSQTDIKCRSPSTMLHLDKKQGPELRPCQRDRIAKMKPRHFSWSTDKDCDFNWEEGDIPLTINFELATALLKQAHKEGGMNIECALLRSKYIPKIAKPEYDGRDKVFAADAQHFVLQAFQAYFYTSLIRRRREQRTLTLRQLTKETIHSIRDDIGDFLKRSARDAERLGTDEMFPDALEHWADLSVGNDFFIREVHTCIWEALKVFVWWATGF